MDRSNGWTLSGKKRDALSSSFIGRRKRCGGKAISIKSKRRRMGLQNCTSQCVCPFCTRPSFYSSFPCTWLKRRSRVKNLCVCEVRLVQSTNVPAPISTSNLLCTLRRKMSRKSRYRWRRNSVTLFFLSLSLANKKRKNRKTNFTRRETHRPNPYIKVSRKCCQQILGKKEKERKNLLRLPWSRISISICAPRSIKTRKSAVDRNKNPFLLPLFAP